MTTFDSMGTLEDEHKMTKGNVNHDGSLHESDVSYHDQNKLEMHMLLKLTTQMK